MRITIAIAGTGCETPGKSVYWTSKNKKNDPDRIELKKYCSYCRNRAGFRSPAHPPLRLSVWLLQQ